MTHRFFRRFSVAGVALACAVALGAPRHAAAQSPDTLLAGRGVTTVAPVYESWNLGSGGVWQPDPLGADSVRVRRVSQWSIPVSVVVPIGAHWTVDASGAYAHGTVSLNGPDTTLHTSSYQLNGITDIQMRLVGRLAGDNLLLTFGVNAPSGKTSLSDEQFKALRVMAAPAFGMTAPQLGTGFGATAGLVAAHQWGAWSWAAGASYQMRRSYVPIATLAEAAGPDFRPGNATRFSIGADRLLGQSALTVRVSAEVYQHDELTLATTGGQVINSSVQLGPTFATDWRLRIASHSIRNFTIRAIYQYRSSFKREGSTVPGSAGSYSWLTVHGLIPVGQHTSLLTEVAGVYQTGLDVNTSLAAAGMTSGGVTFGIAQQMGSFQLTPFVRGQVGRLNTGVQKTTATQYAAGVSMALRY
jgi:hypothetical protein